MGSESSGKYHHIHAELQIVGKKDLKCCCPFQTICIFIIVCKTMVTSHLDYCSSLWLPYEKDDIEVSKVSSK